MTHLYSPLNSSHNSKYIHVNIRGYVETMTSHLAKVCVGEGVDAIIYIKRRPNASTFASNNK